MIDPGDVHKDMYPGSAPEAFDERIVRGDWTYYVRVTKDPDGLVRDKDRSAGWEIGADFADDLGGFLVVLLLVGMFVLILAGVRWGWRALRDGRRTDTRTWTVAVVRMGWVGSWNDLRPEVVHREETSRQDSLEPRIAALVADVRAGRFHPAA